MIDKELRLAQAAKPFRMEGLAEYLERVGSDVGLALVWLRLRQRWTSEQFGREAGIPMELWERWQDGMEVPSAPKLYEVLTNLYWNFWCNSAMLDEVEAADDELWDAFGFDRALDANLLEESDGLELLESWDDL